MADMLTAIHRFGSFTALAPTGSGKTIVGLDTGFELGRKVVVNLHLERLLKQWHDALTDVFGLDPAKIGIIQSDRCEWEDRDVVLAMMPSLAVRRYPAEMYRSFGVALTDEVHRLGQSNLAPTVALFPAAHRIGLSATPDRKDGGDRVIYWQIGDIKARSEATAMACDVYVQRYHTARPVWGKMHGARIKCLSEDPNRNKMHLKNILRLANARRQLLVIGERVLHLQEMMRLCAEAGVPEHIMGQFTGEIHHTEMQTIRGRRRMVSVGKYKPDDAHYDRIKEDPNISLVFATYGSFKEGIDIPRLDAGTDITPYPDGNQVPGRIRRPGDGKKKSIWITTVDEHDWLSKKYFDVRLREYAASGCRVIFDRI
jgi:superfamily II DNA or RNA helicase